MTAIDPANVDLFVEQVCRIAPDVEILTGDLCADRYRDPFGLVDMPRTYAAVRPRLVEDVQSIVRAANTFGVPLWPISRGENLGYGGAGSHEGRSIILDLSRMKRILELSVEDAFCLIEPGVSFLDLFELLEAEGAPLWLSTPGYGLGSIVGNALERGVGSSPYGEHAAQICGLEVVLGDGELVRTGMGAMPGSGMWQRHRTPLGPRYDELFMQSSYGVVTKMGLWLMRAPQTSVAVQIRLPERDALAALVEAMATLKREGVVHDFPLISNYLASAALSSVRTDWAEIGAPLDTATEERICRECDLGWWNALLRLYGPEELVEAGLGQVLRELRSVLGAQLEVSRWRQGDPTALAPRGIPDGHGLANAQWAGPAGAHIDFAVALPLSGAEAFRQAIYTYETLKSFGVDYHSSFHVRERYVLNVVQLLFDSQCDEMKRSVDQVYRILIADAGRRGLGLCRVPLRFRSSALEQFSFGENALARMGARIKRALDPLSVLSPGKDGFA